MKRLSFTVFLLGLLWLASCATPPSPNARWRRFEVESAHMGTMFRMVLFAPELSVAKEASNLAFQRIEELEKAMTDYDPESELMRFSRSEPNRWVPLSPDLVQILSLSQQMAEETGGAFDVTIGPVVQLWRRARRQREMPEPAKLQEARSRIGHQKLRVDPASRSGMVTIPGMRLDLGGIAKGYAADEALKVLRKKGITQALVAASGDIALGDPPPNFKGWKVLFATGKSTNMVERILSNCGVSTSGDTDQFVTLGGVRYSHIVDPATGVGLTNQMTVSVIAPSATLSDAAATAVCVMGKARTRAFLKKRPEIKVLYVEPPKKSQRPPGK